MVEKRAKVLPAVIRKKLDALFAPDQRLDQAVYFLRRIFEVDLSVPPTDPRYLASPKAAVRYVLDSHSSAVKPELVEMMISHGAELSLIKEAIAVLVPKEAEYKASLSQPARDLLMSAALTALHPKIRDGWVEFGRKARPEVVKYLLGLGSDHVLPVSLGWGAKKEPLSLIEASANHGTLTPELSSVFKKAGVKCSSKEPSDFVRHLIDSRRMSEAAAAGLIQGGYTFERATISRADTSRAAYSRFSAPSVKVVQTPLLSLIEAGLFDVAKLVMSQTKQDFSQVDAKGRSALHLACSRGSLDMVSALLGKRGIDIKAADADGKTAMVHAIESRQVAVIEALFEKSKATLTGRFKFKDVPDPISSGIVRLGVQKPAGTEKNLSMVEYAGYFCERDSRLLKEFPERPYVGETAYNDEYTYTLVGGEEVPVDDLYRQHDAQRSQLASNHSSSRAVESRIRALSSPSHAAKP
jgi:hypothetical protein